MTSNILFSILIYILMNRTVSYIRNLSSHRRYSNLKLSDLKNPSACLEFLARPALDLKGVGRVLFEKFSGLNLFTVKDVLFHFPSSIIERKVRDKLSDCNEGDQVVLKVTCESIKQGYGTSPNIVLCRDMDNSLFRINLFYNAAPRSTLLWANLKRTTYVPGNKLLVSGRLTKSKFNNQLEMINPNCVVKFGAPQKEIAKMLEVEPVYPLTAGLTVGKLRGAIADALDGLVKLQGHHQEWMSDEFLAEMKWPGFVDALQSIHRPASQADLHPSHPAKCRLAFEELVALELHRLQKECAVANSMSSVASFAVNGDGSIVEQLRRQLSFTLNECQSNAISAIDSDLSSPNRMVRLLQGDVGSGKTVVAVHAIGRCLEAGKLAVLLAPTEILANQHFSNLQANLLGVTIACSDASQGGASQGGASQGGASQGDASQGDASQGGASQGGARRREARVALLTSSIKAKDREALISALQRGEVDVLVGTHSLLSEPVCGSLRDLSLVVIDEEQRFGVAQREVLSLKTNVLFTTATPIPRTLALVDNDGFKVSTLKSKLPSKREVKTVLVPKGEVDVVKQMLLDHTPFGTKAFWVVPNVNSIEGGDNISAVGRFEELSTLLPGRVALLHGKMTSEEKATALRKFTSGEINVLVTTTVIEVGIDIPDASICIIDKANHFGLSQLHQIRGRIGRGIRPPAEVLQCGICVLMHDSNRASDTNSLSVGDYLFDGDLNVNRTISSSDTACSSASSSSVSIENAPTLDSVKRLEFLANNNDCFDIADFDLELRGPGDVFGYRQHGDVAFKVVSLPWHAGLMIQAKKVAKDIWVGNKLSKICRSNEMGEFISFDSPSIRELLRVYDPTASFKQQSIMLASSAGTGCDYEQRELSEVPVQKPSSSAASLDGSLQSPWQVIVGRQTNLAPWLSGDGNLLTRKVEMQEAKMIGVALPTTIVLDLETTGLSLAKDRVIQIAAKVLGSSSYPIFNAYIKPVEVRIPPFIEKLTGITQAFVESEGISYSEAWSHFTDWLESVRQPGCPVVLVAHYGKGFDFPVLAAEYERMLKRGESRSGSRSGEKFSSNWFEDARVDSLVDSLPVFRSKELWRRANIRNCSISRPNQFSMSVLHKHLTLKPLDDAHNAVADILALERVLEVSGIRMSWREVAQDLQFVYKPF